MSKHKRGSWQKGKKRPDDDPIQGAGQEGIRSLFRYQSFDPGCPTDVEHLKDLLCNHRIFCSNPANFNDPWDCKPDFDPELISDPKTHAAAAEHLIAGQRGGPQGDMHDDALRRSPFVLKTVIRDFSENFTEMIPLRWGVYCLARRPCNTLMWSHYSRNHTGVCLEFGTDQSKFYGAIKVKYKKTYPPFLLHQQESGTTILITKSDVWAYEEEYRLICPRESSIENHPMLMEGNYLSIGSTDLKAIIVGCCASPETVTTIQKLVEENGSSARVRRAVKSSNRYELVIKDLE